MSNEETGIMFEHWPFPSLQQVPAQKYVIKHEHIAEPKESIPLV